MSGGGRGLAPLSLSTITARPVSGGPETHTQSEGAARHSPVAGNILSEHRSTSPIASAYTTSSSLTPVADFFRGSLCSWVVIVIFGILDALWLWYDSIGIARVPFVRFLLSTGFLGVTCWIFRQGRPNFVKLSAARFCEPAAQINASVMVCFPLSYLIVNLNMPLIDEILRAVDGTLGFDWKSLTNFILHHGLVSHVLAYAYISITWQPLIILVICCVGPPGCEHEFVQNYTLCLIICVIVGGILPAIGLPSPFQVLVHAQFSEVRSGHWHVLDYRTMEGIIAFPSFHTAFAIVAVYSVRHNRPAFLIFSVVNLLMLLSIPTFGGHYLTDMIGGAGVASASIVSTNRLRRSDRISSRLTAGSRL